MAKNKERLLFLLKSLMNTSDGASDYTLKELEELYENNGLSATQKTIRNDISKLIEAGFEIEEYSEPGKPTHYSCRLTFEKPELKMIIDAVMAANFISASKCQQLVEKLMSLAGENAKNQYPENGCPDTLIPYPEKRVWPVHFSNVVQV